jgi:hypothetical protein
MTAGNQKTELRQDRGGFSWRARLRPGRAETENFSFIQRRTEINIIQP